MTSVQKFKTFVDENYDKCNIEDTYPINTENMLKWIAAQPEGCARDFAVLFYSKVRHVSFSEWKNRLGNMAAEFLQKIPLQKFDRVAIVINDLPRKSNTMVAVLLFRFMERAITDVISSLAAADKIGLFKPGEKVLFLHVDDCTYSGTQIELSIGELKDLAEKYDGSKYVIACPFIGTAAYELLRHIPLVKFARASDKFPHFLKQVKEDKAVYGCASITDRTMQIFQEEMAATFMYTETVSAIYFDHKLADGISVFQKILALGPVHDGEAIGSLISGCDSSMYKSDGGKPDPTDFIVDFDDNATCPLAFYKKIAYTYRGNPIRYDVHILDQL